MKLWNRIKKTLNRRRTRKRIAMTMLALGVVAICVVPSMQTSINPIAYQPLLRVIAEGESKGNYNAYFGNASNTSVRFTDMTIQEVLAWQDKYVAEGAASNAVGKYQIMGSTLRGLIKQLGMRPETLFNEQTQDRLAIALIDRRGAVSFAHQKITTDQFAANLAMEWAALPAMQGSAAEQSYYAGDGLNSSHVTPAEIRAAIESFRKRL